MRPSLLSALRSLGALAATLIGAALLQGCSQLPLLDDRVPSSAMLDTATTRLGRSTAALVHQHPGKSGIVALADGRDAFAARALLANAAERSLDVQYYIWHGDLSGTLLFDVLRRAADRGVRVRLLLDDNNTRGLDATLAALNAHPNLELRLFNPFAQRRWRALGYLTDFARLNRRMHNKSFTADNRVTIIGGRNVGDEYFGVGQELSFVDLDVLALGPVVNDVSNDFDRYWSSASAYPAERILPPASPETLAALATRAAQLERDPAAAAYLDALARQPFVRDLLEGRLAFDWASTRMVSDDPAKALGRATDDELLWSRLLQVLGKPTRELQLISPYLVPGAEGVNALRALAGQGVKITVLTNSLEATDVAAVHAGYAKRRKPLLEAGIVLFEAKRSAAVPSASDSVLSGSSASSLHAKTFAVDRARVFVGSFNFDPRSARLNTEIGFVIDSPTLAQAMADAFAGPIPARAYQVRLDDSGALRWIEQRGDQQVVHDDEPGTGFWRRFGVGVLSLLPIEWLL